MRLGELLKTLTDQVSTSKDDEIRKNAERSIAQYEERTGTKYEQEPGIEDDYTLEDTASLVATGPASLVRKAGTLAMSSMKDKMPAKKQKKAPGAVDVDEIGVTPTERAGKEWVALGEDQKKGINRQKFIDAYVQKYNQDIQANTEAIRAAKSNRPTPPATGVDLSGQYAKATPTSLKMDPSRKFDVPKKVADVESGKVSSPTNVTSTDKPAEVKDVSFPKYEGKTHQEKMKDKKTNEEVSALEKLLQNIFSKKKDTE